MHVSTVAFILILHQSTHVLFQRICGHIWYFICIEMQTRLLVCSPCCHFSVNLFACIYDNILLCYYVPCRDGRQDAIW